MFKRIAAGAGALALVGASVALASPAMADPVKGGAVIPLTCSDGTAYNVAVNGSGAFSPAHDIASTKLFIPVSFPSSLVTVTDTETGEILDQFFDEEMVATKHANKGQGEPLGCYYEASFVDEEEGVTYIVVGNVFIKTKR